MKFGKCYLVLGEPHSKYYGKSFLKKACTENHDLYFLKYKFASYETHFIVRVEIIFITP